MQSSVLDTNRVMSLLELDEPNEVDSFFADLVKEFTSEASHLIQSINQSIQQQDSASLATYSHSFRGASLNMGAIALARVCDILETDARRSQLAGTYACLGEIETLYQVTIYALETIKDQAINRSRQHGISY